MTNTKGNVTGGVDTHGATHHAAALDELGRELGDREFPTTVAGYRQLLRWLRSFGDLVAVGVEGTGAYGAGLARFLTAHGIRVIEVDRPDRQARRAAGKTDPLDAYAAARAVQSGRATGIPKARSGAAEAIRMLRVVRSSAVKARTVAINEFHALVITAPQHLRETLQQATTRQQLATARHWRPDPTRLSDPTEAAKLALRRLAERIATLNTEIRAASKQLTELTRTTLPRTTAIYGVGPEVAGQLLVTAGDNPHRLSHEGSFAHLTGTAPIPASSGQTRRHRLNRGGDRKANSALYTVAIVRMRHHQPTRDYVTRRTAEGLTKPEIIRCLKRYIAREIYTNLRADLTADALDDL